MECLDIKKQERLELREVTDKAIKEKIIKSNYEIHLLNELHKRYNVMVYLEGKKPVINTNLINTRKQLIYMIDEIIENMTNIKGERVLKKNMFFWNKGIPEKQIVKDIEGMFL